jgi:hypothetical protein
MLVVHFSGAPKGVGRNDHLYPNDLKHVLSGKAQGGISCSTVKPGDRFCGDKRNATGCIGVVVRLNSIDSLIDVSEHDRGSLEIDGERTTHSSRTLTIDDINASILNRSVDQYNEWVVRNYTPIGIFASPPFEISAFVKLPYPKDAPEHLLTNDPILGIGHSNIEEILRDFSPSPVYSFCRSGIIQCQGDGFKSINHTDLYPHV